MENNREPEHKHQFETQTGAGGLKFSLLVLTTPFGQYNLVFNAKTTI